MRCGSVVLVVLVIASFIAPANVLAADVLPTYYATVLDFDRVHQAMDYMTGGMVSSGGDFWIADRTTGDLAHNWEGGGNTEGIIDMGEVKFDEVNEAPATGYQTDAIALEGHTYVTSSPMKGRYGKFYIDGIVRAAAATQYSIRYAYQPSGSRNLRTTASQAQTAQPAVTQPATTGGTYSGAATSAGGGFYENYQGSPDVGGDVRMNYWHGQTFTSQSDHQANAVSLMAYRIGYPGTLIVSLRATGSGGHPAGYDLASGSTSGDTLPLSQSGEWREITLSQPVDLIAGTRYAIVARAPGGGGGNAVKWLTDTTAPDYPGGNREASGDSGASWQSDLNSDYLFEILGPTSGSTQTGTGAGGGQSAGTTTTGSWDTSSGGATAGGVSGTATGTTGTGATTSSATVTVPPVDSGSGTLHLTCVNKDNSEKTCCCFQAGHTYQFGPYNVSSISVIFDTGRRLTCQSTVDLQVEKGGVWQTIKQVKATSSSGGSELAPIKADVQVNDVISGFRISDGCVCCIDNSEITIYLLGGAVPASPTVSPVTTAPSSTGTVATAAAGPRLIAESRVAMTGDTVLVPLKLENARSIGSLGYSVQYDPAVIEFVKADKGAAIPDDASFIPNSPQPGTVIIAYATSGAINGNGTAAQLEFKAIGSQGSQSAISLSEITATGTTGGQIDISPVGGQVTIGQKIKGDGTGDGRVTVLDALMALKMYVKAMAENLVLDVNNDGKVTPEDARQILKMAKPK